MIGAYTCIVCPQSCDLQLDKGPNGDFVVAGNRCKRGAAYAVEEYTAPVRTLTTTMATKGGTLRRLPVVSSRPVPKEKLRACLAALYGGVAAAPVRMGDVLIPNLLGTGADILAARDLELKTSSSEKG